MKVNQINGLNRQSRKFLLEHCVSKRGAEIMAYRFIGYINGEHKEDLTLIRRDSNLEIYATQEKILSISGEIEFFALTRNSIL